jgi:CRISPR-associated protein Cmr3
MSKTLRLALVPRDGLFFKDGRGWYTSHSGRGHALDWPWPSSIRGALCTAVGRRQEAEKGSIHCKKEWRDLKVKVQPQRQLALRRELGKDWTRNHRMWPVPRDAVFLENNEAETKQCKVTRLIPQEHLVAGILSNAPKADSALWFPVLETEDEESIKPLTPPRWWNETTFVRWLRGEDVTATIHQGKADGPHMEKQARIHVVIDSDKQTAEKKGLYTTEIVETLQREKEGSYEWAIGVEVETPEVTAPRLATLGSDRRPAFVEELEDTPLFESPGNLLEQIAGSKRLRLILVTPAKFEEGWLPDGFELKDNVYRGNLPEVEGEVILRSALVGRPINISGWDMAERRPKGTDRMAPPGSVYFFEKANGQAFTADEVQALWLANLGDRVEDGFGLVVPGIWQNQGDAS